MPWLFSCFIYVIMICSPSFIQARNYTTEPGYADWFCPKHKKQFYDIDSWNKHLVKYHKLNDKIKETNKRITIFDGKTMWVLTEDGLKKMKEENTTVEKTPQIRKPNYQCPYCPMKFYTHGAFYWHRKNAHPNYIYSR
jgi:hypothetical protein